MKKSRSKMKNSMSRETTKDEARKEFLNAVKDIADCWVHSEGTTVDEKCNGVAFSILVLLDGCNVNVPVFSVIPVPHSSDKEYSIQKGENYYADVCESSRRESGWPFPKEPGRNTSLGSGRDNY